MTSALAYCDTEIIVAVKKFYIEGPEIPTFPLSILLLWVQRETHRINTGAWHIKKCSKKSLKTNLIVFHRGTLANNLALGLSLS